MKENLEEELVKIKETITPLVENFYNTYGIIPEIVSSEYYLIGEQKGLVSVRVKVTIEK